MIEAFKKFYNGISFETFLAVQVVFFSGLISVLIALSICTSRTEDQLKQNFFDKCASACYPNTVYSTDYNRCSCNAAVVVREIK
jgi:hypothetical protein